MCFLIPKYGINEHLLQAVVKWADEDGLKTITAIIHMEQGELEVMTIRYNLICFGFNYF
ncbi:protein of unknown function [Legionella fallonii LLAP-10]|uniref:Uncharacterized protein n=1 Tax=Legionella fallonii LLAP-10 TaxID=1212491 RepID=A0A098G7V7_9GAMM|nr:protein of unknown function [Legionella fallonii LLAP-10]